MDQLKIMETFINIARTGSLAKAAQQLALSPAVVSKHLQQLEDHLGTRLVNRTTRKVSLTETGQQYYEFCAKIVAEVREEDAAVSNLQNQLRGSLKLIAPPSFGNLQLGPLVAEFIRLYPNIQISLTLTAYDILELDSRNVDLAIYLSSHVPDTSMVGRKIGEVKWIVCASPGYLARRRAPESPDELSDHECLILRIPSGNDRWRFVGAEGAHEVKVTGPLTTNSVLSAKASAMSGAGIALLPMYCIGSELETGELVELLPGYEVQRRNIFVIYRKNRYLPGKIRTFIDFLANRLKENPSTKPTRRFVDGIPQYAGAEQP